MKDPQIKAVRVRLGRLAVPGLVLLVVPGLGPSSSNSKAGGWCAWRGIKKTPGINIWPPTYVQTHAYTLGDVYTQKHTHSPTHLTHGNIIRERQQGLITHDPGKEAIGYGSPPSLLG